MRAAAIVINHNGGEDLGKCLQALALQTIPVEIILVDNASTDTSRQWVEHPPPGVRVIALEENLGYTGGANKGLVACNSEVEVVGFFNPDCFPRPDFFATCFQAFWEKPNLGGLAPRLLREDLKTLDSCGQVLSSFVLMVKDRGYGQPAAGAFLSPAPVLAACGAGMVFRRRALEQVKRNGEVFPSSFFAFWEDMDLGWRLFNLGGSLYYWPAAVAVHRRAATAAPGRGRLIFRRPPKVAADILLNRWATLLRNLHWTDAWWRLPLLLFWDMAAVFGLLLRKPKAFPFLVRGVWRLRLAWGQRRTLPRRPLRELQQ